MTTVYIEDHNLVIEWNDDFVKIPMIKKQFKNLKDSFTYELPKVDIEAEVIKLKKRLVTEATSQTWGCERK